MRKLTLQTFNPGAEAIFPVSSTLICGEKEAILVDAQFQAQYAREVVAMVKASGRTLKAIYVSHSDPDYYFGLSEIHQAFPEAKILSTAQTAYLISASKDEKTAVWNAQLKADAPSEIIVPEAVQGNTLELEGEKIEIHFNPADSAHSFLWIPALKTVLGGISVASGSHLWMADTDGVKGIDDWIAVVDAMSALHPEQVIPSHYLDADYQPEILAWVKAYLLKYRTFAEDKLTATEIAEQLRTLYPGLPGEENMAFGAQVFTGAAPWHVFSPYPPIGGKAQVNFADGAVVFDLDFSDNQNMTFTDATGAFGGISDTVQYHAVEVAKGVFMVYWSEPNSTRANVVHVQDYNTGTVYTNISGADGSFTNLKGTIRLL